MSSTIPAYSDGTSQSTEISIQQICSPIQSELDLTKNLYENTILATSERNLLEKLVSGDGRLFIPEPFRVSVVDAISEHLLKGEGKWVRAAMALLSASSFGIENESARQIATGVELVHLATLVHDDIIDEAPMRRGVETVSNNWGNSIAVLLGDFLFCKAFKLLLASKCIQAQTMLTHATGQMCLGEIRELEYSYHNGVNEADYLEMISCKTASLMAAATASGAELAELDEETVEHMHGYGHCIGMAFQITDDVLDYTAHLSTLGKEQGVDVRNGKATLPLIHLFERESQKAEAILDGDASVEEKREALLGLMNELGSIEYAYSVGRKYGDLASEHLNAVAPHVKSPECIQSLQMLIDFILRRDC
ncbi:MAG: polyprenyl synthetase family protein [Candidatus Hinthialibacter antarcticus]|nr:polyprenyl synthetase family protein [Candidatus Hinthialibacter antarcticus]